MTPQNWALGARMQFWAGPHKNSSSPNSVSGTGVGVLRHWPLSPRGCQIDSGATGPPESVASSQKLLCQHHRTQSAQYTTWKTWKKLGGSPPATADSLPWWTLSLKSATPALVLHSWMVSKSGILGEEVTLGGAGKREALHLASHWRLSFD